MSSSFVTPGDNDVLLGRGYWLNVHVGNQRLRNMVRMQQHEFIQASKKEKRDIACSIVEDIRKKGGRFLIEDPNSNEETMPYAVVEDRKWVCVDTNTAVRQVMGRLREKKKKKSSPSEQPKSAVSSQDQRVENITSHSQKQSASDPSSVPYNSHTCSNSELPRQASLDLDINTKLNGLLDIPQGEPAHHGDQVTSFSSQEKSISNHHPSSCGASAPVEIASGGQHHSNGIPADKKLGGNNTPQLVQQPAMEIKTRDDLAAFGSTPNHATISAMEWINDAKEMSHNEYIESAVSLALVLAKQLSELGPAAGAYLQDINVQNVIIPVEPGSSSMLLPGGTSQRYLVKNARFLFDTPNIAPTNLSRSTTNVHNSQLICLSLGKVLLDVFAKNHSRNIHFSNDTNNMRQRGGDDSTLKGNDDDKMPSMDKRMTKLSVSSSISAKAKHLLLELGMPLSICRLVCDLLDTTNEPTTTTTPMSISLDQALQDLTQMESEPQLYLYDRAFPAKALADTHLFDAMDEKLFGREDEINILMGVKDRISKHLNCNAQDVNGSMQGGNFLCEMAFLSGYAGSGKSCLLRLLIKACEKEHWFVLKCKFDKKAAPLTILAKAFDDFFGEWIHSTEDTQHESPMKSAFNQICDTIFATIDNGVFDQLSVMVPNLLKISPPVARFSGGKESSSADPVYLFHVLLASLCSSGYPILIALDDLQWSDSAVTGCLADFLMNYINGAETLRQGLLIAGTYRNNEVKESDDLVNKISLIKESSRANVTKLDIDGLTEGNITQLLSAKLGLPLRYTYELAQLVQRKTKGNPFHTLQFLRSIIQNKMLTFSVRTRRWEWDCITIDLQMISTGVAELLTSTFNRLPLKLMKSLKVLSCFGSQIDTSTIDHMNSQQQVLPFDMHVELGVAVKEGLLEKAGPVYQFTHDLIHHTLYDLIPASSRHLLHKTIGMNLLESNSCGQTNHLLAVDQINLFCKKGQPSEGERSRFATANATAAKYSISASSFEKAQSYVDMGIKLLDDGHWETQYCLSLNLFEMSASLCSMRGDTEAMASHLDEILSHCRTFDDSLNASYMLAKLLASESKHNEAIENCIAIVRQLGEVFPPQPTLGMVLSKLSSAQPLLLNLTLDQMKSLPPMTDMTKLHAMKFLGKLCSISYKSDPMLLPLFSIRMMELTLKHGFCENSIIGLVFVGCSLCLFTDDIQLGYRIGKVGEAMIEKSQNKHALRSRLCFAWDISLKSMIEPFQVVFSACPSLFESAMLTGDVASAMMCRWTYSQGSFIIGENLTSLSKHFILSLQQSARYHQHDFLHLIMASHNAFVRVSGIGSNYETKSYDELEQIGMQSKNKLLLFQVFFSKLMSCFWFRDYTSIVDHCKNFPQQNYKRTLDTVRCFFEGIASLNVARRTGESRLKNIGEEAVKQMSKFATNNKWSYENKLKLLEAELHYLNKDFQSAEKAYKASIKSAENHKFIHEEALAYELYGIFCIECAIADKGVGYLNTSLEKYKQWGAKNKVDDLQQFMDKTSGVITNFP